MHERPGSLVERVERYQPGRVLVDVAGRPFVSDLKALPECCVNLPCGEIYCAPVEGTASGVLMGKLMNRLSSSPINPLIGAAGVSAVPDSARDQIAMAM